MVSCNTLLDNTTDGSLDLRMVTALQELVSDEHFNTICIATGYWDIPGTALILHQLKSFLSRPDTKIQILIGCDPEVRISQLKHPIQGAVGQKEYIKRDLAELEVKDEFVDVVTLLREYCLEDFDASRIQIKMCKVGSDGEVRFFHAKCYIFLGPGVAKGIIGSSNFTQKGLEGNAELNYLETDPSRVTAVPNEYSFGKGHKKWFDDEWALADEWNKIFREQVLMGTKVDDAARQKEKKEEEMEDAEAAPLTPYELYIKLLDYKFGAVVDLDQQHIIESYLPKGFQALDYQTQAVRQCFAIMQEHGGFMLADVVGLGKTIVGVLVIKHFISMADDDRPRKVLVITPPAVKSAWVRTVEQFDADTDHKIMESIDFLSTGKVSSLGNDDEEDAVEDDDDSDTGDFEAELQKKEYGLIIIDESHKFRNNKTNMYLALDKLIAEIGVSVGLYPYVGLLSATPQNNRPEDLQNQIYLFEREHAASTLRKAAGGNIESFFASVKKEYRNIIHAKETDNPEVNKAKLKALSEKIRECVLDDILVRRTRTDVIKYYGANLTFPKISGPHSLEYKMDDELAQLFARTMDLIVPSADFDFNDTSAICYFRYQAIRFLKTKEVRDNYKGGNLDVDRYSRQLAKIMQINLVKRLESSFPAFKESLANFKRYTQTMIEMWNKNVIFICPDIDVNEAFNKKKKFDLTGVMPTFEGCAESVRAKINTLQRNGRDPKRRNREFTRDDFDPIYIDLLQKDLDLVEMLCAMWQKFDYDPKLEVFKDSLIPVLFNPERNPQRKLVIFTESVVTAMHVSRTIKLKAPDLKVLTVNAQNRNEKEQVIIENFDANYKGEQKDDYQVIVTTEVLAEGINLHRANSILNYDTPWNATRLMQRIGRVNRIGSTSPFVFVYNFMPSAQGDAQINLVRNAYTKLQSFHTLFGEDSQIFTADEEVTHWALNNFVNGPESPMEKYISELKEYKDANPDRYAQIVGADNDLERAVEGGAGNGLFVVRREGRQPIFVSVPHAADASILSAADMFEAFRTSPEAKAAPLPDDWNTRKSKALQRANIAVTAISVHARNSQAEDEAKANVQRLAREAKLSDASKAILFQAERLVRSGNADVAKKIIAICAEREDGSSIFDMTEDEVEALLREQIAKVVERVKKQNVKMEVFLGLDA